MGVMRGEGRGEKGEEGKGKRGVVVTRGGGGSVEGGGGGDAV